MVFIWQQGFISFNKSEEVTEEVTEKEEEIDTIISTFRFLDKEDEEGILLGDTVDTTWKNGSYWARLTRGERVNPNNPLEFYQAINTPDHSYEIDFDYIFMTETGILDLLLDSRVLGTLKAEESIIGEPAHFNLLLTDPAYFTQKNAIFKFRLFGSEQSQVLITNVSVKIPEAEPKISQALKEGFLYNVNDNYISVKESLKENGWIPIIPDSYENSFGEEIEGPVIQQFPEIISCGSGRDAICSVNFEKIEGEIEYRTHLNIHSTLERDKNGNLVWIVVGSE